MKPIDDVSDQEFEEDFEEMHETDEEIDDLYNAREYVIKKMVKDQPDMDDKKWDEIVQDGVKHGFLMHTKECEDILEDMLSWDKLLPGTHYIHSMIHHCSYLYIMMSVEN
jgi:small subunit ribosomal protein S35